MTNYSNIQVGTIVRHKLLHEVEKCDQYKVIEIISDREFRCECLVRDNYIRNFNFDELIIIKN